MKEEPEIRVNGKINPQLEPKPEWKILFGTSDKEKIHFDLPSDDNGFLRRVRTYAKDEFKKKMQVYPKPSLDILDSPTLFDITMYDYIGSFNLVKSITSVEFNMATACNEQVKRDLEQFEQIKYTVSNKDLSDKEKMEKIYKILGKGKKER